jgi:hypothetical protein
MVIPPTGSVGLDILDSDLTLESATDPGNQVVRWTFLSASADIEGFGSYSFLGFTPCTYTDNIFVRPTLQKSCGGSNLVIGAKGSLTATMHLVISSMEVRRAFRPDLAASGDYDGDGIPNGVDNCPLVPNPGQEPYASLTTGAACTHLNAVTGSVAVDSDGDGVADGFDDCLWVANTDQADSDLDGIGDACEQIARVVLAPGPYRLDLPPVTFAATAYTVKTLTVDFNLSQSLVGCDPSFTRCYLNPAAVKVEVP